MTKESDQPNPTQTVRVELSTHLGWVQMNENFLVQLYHTYVFFYNFLNYLFSNNF